MLKHNHVIQFGNPALDCPRCLEIMTSPNRANPATITYIKDGADIVRVIASCTPIDKPRSSPDSWGY